MHLAIIAMDSLGLLVGLLSLIHFVNARTEEDAQLAHRRFTSIKVCERRNCLSILDETLDREHCKHFPSMLKSEVAKLLTDASVIHERSARFRRDCHVRSQSPFIS